MIRAAIIGMGWWGRTIARDLAASDLIRPLLGVDPDATGRTAATALGMRTAADFDTALQAPDIDAVVLCTPHRFHAEQIEKAAQAGKHVFCEKPLCLTGADVRRAVAAVKKAGVTLGIGHERRFEPAMIELRQRFKAGEFGEILQIEANFSQDKFFALPPDNWRLSPVLAPNGPLTATGIHLVDLSIACLGLPQAVWARNATRGSNFANGDTMAIMLGFPGGANALISAMLATPFVGRFAVYGSKGWMEIRDRTHPELPTGWDVGVCHRGGTPNTRFFEPHPVVRANLEAFASAAMGGAPYPVGMDEMLANVLTLEAINRSIASGGLVTPDAPN
jgi:predicted dehydrogenase